MKEIYFLKLIGSIGDTFDIICVLLVILLCIFIFIFLMWWFMENDYNKEQSDILTKIKKHSKTCIVAFVISIVGTIFIPSSKETMLIYGLGRTIDYIKSNDKAKELPDKVIDALTESLKTTKKKD